MAYRSVFRKLQDVVSAGNFSSIYFKSKRIRMFESILNHFIVTAG